MFMILVGLEQTINTLELNVNEFDPILNLAASECSADAVSRAIRNATIGVTQGNHGNGIR
jgi:hypothetical protein